MIKLDSVRQKKNYFSVKYLQLNVKWQMCRSNFLTEELSSYHICNQS